MKYFVIALLLHALCEIGLARTVENNIYLSCDLEYKTRYSGEDWLEPSKATIDLTVIEEPGGALVIRTKGMNPDSYGVLFNTQSMDGWQKSIRNNSTDGVWEVEMRSTAINPGGKPSDTVYIKQLFTLNRYTGFIQIETYGPGFSVYASGRCALHREKKF